jgi:integrase/recombinase XerD
VCGKGGKVVLVPLPPAVGRAIDRAVADRTRGPVLLNSRGARMGVDLRDVQIAARHADPRTTMRYDRAGQNLDRHPNYILGAFTASGT